MRNGNSASDMYYLLQLRLGACSVEYSSGWGIHRTRDFLLEITLILVGMDW